MNLKFQRMKINPSHMLLIVGLSSIILACTEPKYPSVQRIEIFTPSPNMGTDTTLQFTAIGIDEEGNAISGLSFTWTSSDSAVGQISNDGILRGLSQGVVRIQAQFGDILSNQIEIPVYSSVKIGDQVWMKYNLTIRSYRNGDSIYLPILDSTWVENQTAAMCYYNNDSRIGEIYGALYNFYAVTESRNIAPAGWHVSTDEDWIALEKSLGMSEDELYLEGIRGTNEGGSVKEAGTSHWDTPNTGANNLSNFTALPGGAFGTFYNFTALGKVGFFWTPSVSELNYPYCRILFWDHSDILRGSLNKEYFFSVRCVKDSEN